MDMRTVYRYENDEGVGPYCTDNVDVYVPLCNAHNSENGHPAWTVWFGEREFEKTPGEEYLAGCASREELDAWFDGWHGMLAENGFTVKEYTVPAENVIDSRSGLQVAFLPT